MSMESFPQQGPSVEDTSTHVLNGLKQNALDIQHLSIAGESTDKINMRPNTWNENNGIIIFADESGKLFAMPASDEVRTELFQNAVEKEEGAGVPALNNKENWLNTNGQDSSFSQWQKLVERHTAKERTKELAGEEVPQ